MNPMLLTAGVLSVLLLASLQAKGQDVKQVVVTICSNCHGVDGNSIHPRYPNLAGQAKEYLIDQLKAFRDKSRKDPDAHAFMWGIAQLIDAEQAVKLADYFSAQKPARGQPGDPQLAAQGKVIFERGVPSKKVPACAWCHREDAQGTAVIPRLAGQHAEYLEAQMKEFHLGSRPNLAMTMKAVVERLSDEEAKQVAAYIQGM